MKRSMIAIIGLILALFLVGSPASAVTWYVPGSFPTIQDAVNAASDGDTLIIGPAVYYGAIVTKRLEIRGQAGAIIHSGPSLVGEGIVNGLALLRGSDGSTISRMEFQDLDGSGISGYSVNDVTVTDCTFTRCGQGILNFAVKRWNITHNTIMDPQWTPATVTPILRGGGGINLVTRYDIDSSTDNVIEYNTISGKVGCKVCKIDPATYSPTGRNAYGFLLQRSLKPAGTTQVPGAITRNYIRYNTVNLVVEEDLAALVGLPRSLSNQDTQSSTSKTPRPQISGNTISYNDFRGTAVSISTATIHTTDSKCVANEQYDQLGLNTISDNRGGPVAQMSSLYDAAQGKCVNGYIYINNYSGITADNME